uniref:Uncharacterized protein n=1 Tax=Acrobeloides nanus TaxID=290746 RepID=A0A914CNW3_9BILA
MPNRISNGLPNQNPEFNNLNMTMKLPPNNPLPSTSSQNPMLSTPNNQQAHATTTAENLGPSTSQLNMQTSHKEYVLVDVNPMSTQDQRPEAFVPNHGHLYEEFTWIDSHPNASNADSFASKEYRSS